MKTWYSMKCIRGGKSHLFLLTVFLLLAGTMSIQAADDEVFWVGSVKVNGQNSNNNIHGGNIKSGTVSYDASSKTLTLTDVYIYAKGSGGDCIHNKSCSGLKVEFYGDNDLNAIDDYAIWCEVKTSFYVKSGTTQIYNYKNNKSCVYLDGNHTCTFRTENGAGLDIISDSYYAIQGIDGSDLTIRGGKIEIDGPKGGLVNLDEVNISKSDGVCDVKLYWTDGSSYPIVRSVNSMSGINYSTANVGASVIVSPNKAEFKSSKKSVCDSSGTPIYANAIVISNDFVALLNSNYFPDANFRNYLENRFGTVILKQSHINGCTSMDVSGRSISSLEGIGYFTELQTLNCYNNNLTSLSAILKKLTTLDCRNNKITSLPAISNNIKYLYCDNNKLTDIAANLTYKVVVLSCSNNNLTSLKVYDSNHLTSLDCSKNNLSSIDVGSQGGSLETLNCENNAFTSLSLLEYSKLSTFKCSNNPQLKTLRLKNNNNMKSLSLYSVPALEEVDCSYNSGLTSLDLSNCTSLHKLVCTNNQLTSMSLPSSISSVDCRYNKFTSLNVSGFQSLISIDCSRNESLTSLQCSNNPKLTTISFENCWALKTFQFSNNASMTKFDCSNMHIENLNVSYNNNLETLYCHNNDLTSLSLNGCNKLQSLTCDRNSLKGAAMDAIIAALPDRTGTSAGSIRVLFTGTNFVADENVCTTTQSSVARSKNWYTYQSTDGSNWRDYYGYWDGAPTDIRTTETDLDDDAPRYNMSGQRVGNDYKGVVIVNGKKKVVR